MKLRTLPLFLYLLVGLFLFSCSIEKRRYNKGYHIKNYGQRSSRTGETQKNLQLEVKPESSVALLDNHLVPEKHAFLVEASDQLAVLDATFPKMEVEVNEENAIPPSASVEPERSTATLGTHIPKKPNKKYTQTADENKSGTGNPGIVFGIVLLIIGVLFFLFLSILIGVILAVFGLVLLTVGATKAKINSENKSKPLIDVVYLKNGSIIRGTIIEQVPNTSLKIQTKDGSVFFYKLEEVEKMTKEPPK